MEHDTPPTPKSLRGMKALVIIMGLAMIAGMGIMAYVAIAQMTAGDAQKPAATCVEQATITLPEGEISQPIEHQGDVSVITLKDDTGYSVVTVERCGGAVIQMLTIAN